MKQWPVISCIIRRKKPHDVHGNNCVQKKSHHFHPCKKLVVFSGTGNQNMEISRKSQHPLDVDSRPNWDVTRKVGERWCWDPTWMQHVNLSTSVPRSQCFGREGSPGFFFGVENFWEHRKVKTIEKPVENKHSAFLGINVIDMCLYVQMSQLLLKFRVLIGMPLQIRMLLWSDSQNSIPIPSFPKYLVRIRVWTLDPQTSPDTKAFDYLEDGPPISKWLTTMVHKSPSWGCGTLSNGLFLHGL